MKTSLFALAILVGVTTIQTSHAGSCREAYVSKIAKMKKNHNWRVLGTYSVGVPAAATLMGFIIASTGPVAIIPAVMAGASVGTMGYFPMTGIHMREESIHKAQDVIDQLYRDRIEVNKELREAYINSEMMNLNFELEELKLPLLMREQVAERVKDVKINSHVDNLLAEVNKKRADNNLSGLSYEEMKKTLLETEETESYLCRHSWRGPLAYTYRKLFKKVKNGLAQ